MAESVTQVPAVEGWFTSDAREPRLIGARCPRCTTIVFPPRDGACPNPDCDSDTLERTAAGSHPHRKDVPVHRHPEADRDDRQRQGDFEPELRDQPLDGWVASDPLQHEQGLREDSQHQDLRAENCQRASQQRKVRMQLMPEDPDLGERNRGDQCEPEHQRAQAWHREQPPGAEEQHEPQMSPAIAPRPQVGAPAAAIGPQARGYFPDA